MQAHRIPQWQCVAHAPLCWSHRPCCRCIVRWLAVWLPARQHVLPGLAHGIEAVDEPVRCVGSALAAWFEGSVPDQLPCWWAGLFDSDDDDELSDEDPFASGSDEGSDGEYGELEDEALEMAEESATASLLKSAGVRFTDQEERRIREKVGHSDDGWHAAWGVRRSLSALPVRTDQRAHRRWRSLD